MKQEGHIVKSYDEEIRDIKNNIVDMGSLVENQLKDSLQCLKDKDTEFAEKIIENDNVIDKAYNTLDQSLVEILGKRQPMAADLRTIFSAIKINKDLERIGDHASNIAGRILHVKKAPENYLTDSIYQLGQLVLKNFSKALSSYDQQSQKIAQIVPAEDVTINSVYETCFREHLHLMMEEPKILGFCTQMLFIAKELERIGDLSKVISKEVAQKLKELGV